MDIGPTNSLLDVPGLRVGHKTAAGAGWLTGTTAVIAAEPGPHGDVTSGAVCGVDVRGGGPGTRETDALDPRNVVERVHAIVLTGGSAYGLAAASGVADALGADGIGFPVGPEPGHVVPIVPAAVVFDLGRGGDFTARPDATFGTAAYTDATTPSAPSEHLRLGSLGAGTGAIAGGFAGGVGTASCSLPDGTTVAALVVANSRGAVVDLRTGELPGARYGIGDEFSFLRAPSAADLAAASARATSGESGLPFAPPFATTIGVLATDATLTVSQCAKLAGIGQDGVARAVRPAHTHADGDTIFAVSTTARPAPDAGQLYDLMVAAGDCVSRAIVHAILAASSVETPGLSIRSYRDAFPSAFS